MQACSTAWWSLHARSPSASPEFCSTWELMFSDSIYATKPLRGEIFEPTQYRGPSLGLLVAMGSELGISISSIFQGAPAPAAAWPNRVGMPKKAGDVLRAVPGLHDRSVLFKRSVAPS